MNRPALFGVVSISGACVLVLEILGTRILGPFYGVSLFLWSALIGVTLAALALGYAWGGRLAMRSPSGSRLALLLALAGLWVLLTPWLKGPVVHAALGLGLRAAVLVSATLLFFPPLALLGAVTPYAIRLATRSVDEVSRVSGDLFAISTLASVIAAVATGFVLIPTLGVNRLLMAVGVALFAAAALARGPGVRSLAILVAGVAVAATTGFRAERHAPGVLEVRESPYGELRVLEAGGFRYLLIDGSPHTVFSASTGVPWQPYVYAAELAADLGPRRGRLLLIGLGGGGAAELFARDGWSVDAVELDPEVPALAARWFGLKPFHARVIIGEGRQFLTRGSDRYDAIFLDAFGSASVPFHLLTREAFAAARARLAPDGILILNIQTVGWHDPLTSAVTATLQTQFAHVIALPTGEPPNRLGNVVLMASNRALELDPDVLGDPVGTLTDDDEHFRVVTRHHAWENQFVPRFGRVLTDDWNPVDLRAEEINLAARRLLRTQVPDSLLAN
jgi:spermidine synthase